MNRRSFTASLDRPTAEYACEFVSNHKPSVEAECAVRRCLSVSPPKRIRESLAGTSVVEYAWGVYPLARSEFHMQCCNSRHLFMLMAEWITDVERKNGGAAGPEPSGLGSQRERLGQSITAVRPLQTNKNLRCGCTAGQLGRNDQTHPYHPWRRTIYMPDGTNNI